MPVAISPIGNPHIILRSGSLSISLDSDPLVFMSPVFMSNGVQWESPTWGGCGVWSLCPSSCSWGESTGAGLVGQGEAQGEPVGCRGDGEGVGAHEWYVARPLVVGLEGDETTQLVLGTQSQASVR